MRIYERDLNQLLEYSFICNNTEDAERLAEVLTAYQDPIHPVHIQGFEVVFVVAPYAQGRLDGMRRIIDEFTQEQD